MRKTVNFRAIGVKGKGMNKINYLDMLSQKRDKLIIKMTVTTENYWGPLFINSRSDLLQHMSHEGNFFRPSSQDYGLGVFSKLLFKSWIYGLVSDKTQCFFLLKNLQNISMYPFTSPNLPKREEKKHIVALFTFPLYVWVHQQSFQILCFFLNLGL